MREETINLELGEQKLIDIDCSSTDDFVGYTDKGTIITPYDEFRLNNEFQFPIIRQINERLFLVADARTGKGIENCFMFDFNGNLIRQFLGGDGIEDIAVARNRIIISYFDEGVVGGQNGTDPNKEGLAIFNINGQYEWGYNTNRSKFILDCYCLCRHGANRIMFLPYTEFPLIELNLDTLEERIYDIPEILKGSNSMTSIGDSLIFHSPYEDERGLFKWKIGDKNAQKIGEYSTGLRGLKNGRFVAHGDKGFTILDFA